MSASPLTPAGLVLAGFIPDDLDRMRRALALPDDAFIDKSDSFLFRLYREYWRVHRGMLPIQFIGDRLKTEPADVSQRIAERFVALREATVTDDVWEWAYSSTLEGWRDDEARAVLSQAVRILAGPGDVEGSGEDAHAVRGYEAMRHRLSLGWSRIDRSLGGGVPEVQMSEAADDLLAIPGSAHEGARVSFPTGIDVLDAACPFGGPVSGQLWFVAAYSGQGKTTFCTSVLTYQAMLRGLNVLYLTGETLMQDCQLAVVARHTRMPQFGMPSGIDRLAINRGLPPDQLAVFHAAVTDLTSRSGVDYGRVLFRQMPMRNDVDDVLETLQRVEAEWPIHMLIVDSIDMIRPSERVRGMSTRDRLSEVIEDFASLAVAHQGGQGMIVVSPYQTNRVSYDRALENKGRYELSSLSETAMAERRASVVLSLLARPDVPGQLHAQVLKNRNGPTLEFPLDFDPRSAYIGAGAGAMARDTTVTF